MQGQVSRGGAPDLGPQTQIQGLAGCVLLA